MISIDFRRISLNEGEINMFGITKVAVPVWDKSQGSEPVSPCIQAGLDSCKIE